MVAETVLFDIRRGTEQDNSIVELNPDAYGFPYAPWAPVWYPAVAEVTADFNMANPTGEDVSMTVWFPLASALETVEWELNPDEIVPRIVEFRVGVNGQEVDVTESDWPNPRGEDRPRLPWASFPVTFPAGGETTIQVRYAVPGQRTVDDHGMTFYYIFQTGAGWAGPIGSARLSVRLPYPASPETIGEMPEGGHTEGQQVSWTWENLEPGPQDDFSMWLLLPDLWDELQAARSAVNANPENGEAWLNLADLYRNLILGKYRILPGFGETYRPLGVQAAEEALRRLPDHGRPHYELAIFYLAALPQNPSPQELQPFLQELEMVETLAPSYAGDVHDWFEFITGVGSWTDYWATETAIAAERPTASTTPIASATPQLPPTPTTSQPGTNAAVGPGLATVVLAAAVCLIVAGYLVFKRRRAN
jgi:hypothetical protein